MSEESPSSSPVEEPQIKVLLADDEEMSRRGFTAALTENRGVRLVGSTTLGADLHRLVRFTRPDVVLLIAASACEWRAAVRAILAEQPQPDAPQIILVTQAQVEDLLHAVYDGVAGLLLRDVSVDELNYAIRHVAAGHAVISPVATSYVLARLRCLIGRTGGPAPDLAAIRELSRRERQILAALAAGQSNQEIALHTRLTVATVKSHVSRILTKLQVRDRVQAALLGQWAGVAAEVEVQSVGPADRRGATTRAE